MELLIKKNVYMACLPLVDIMLRGESHFDQLNGSYGNFCISPFNMEICRKILPTSDKKYDICFGFLIHVNIVFRIISKSSIYVFMFHLAPTCGSVKP